jgi:hypothetical protein
MSYGELDLINGGYGSTDGKSCSTASRTSVRVGWSGSLKIWALLPELKYRQKKDN